MLRLWVVACKPTCCYIGLYVSCVTWSQQENPFPTVTPGFVRWHRCSVTVFTPVLQAPSLISYIGFCGVYGLSCGDWRRKNCDKLCNSTLGTSRGARWCRWSRWSFAHAAINLHENLWRLVNSMLYPYASSADWTGFFWVFWMSRDLPLEPVFDYPMVRI